MTIEFDEIIFYWRGPAPFFFVAIPTEQSNDIKAISGLVTYGWGVIPVKVQIGTTEWTTSLIPKDGRYLVPLKNDIRKAEKLSEGDSITVQVTI